MQTRAKLFWDRLGISLSLICAVHCLFFPILLAFLPFWFHIEKVHGWVHPVLLFLILPPIFLAVRNKLYSNTLLILFGAGAGLLVVAWAAHYGIGSSAETVLTLIGGILIGAGHLKNYLTH